MKLLCLKLQTVCSSQTPPELFGSSSCSPLVLAPPWHPPNRQLTPATGCLSTADSNESDSSFSFAWLLYPIVVSFPASLSCWLLNTLVWLCVLLHLVCLSVLRDPAVTCLFYTFLPMLFPDIFRVSAQFVLSFAAWLREGIFVLR